MQAIPCFSPLILFSSENIHIQLLFVPYNHYYKFMNILTKRLIGLAAALAAAGYVALTHSSAVKTYLEDRMKDEKKEDDSPGDDK